MTGYYYEKLAFAITHYANRLEQSIIIDEIKHGPALITLGIKEKVAKARKISGLLIESDNDHIIRNNLPLVCEALNLFIMDVTNGIKKLAENMSGVEISLKKTDDELKPFLELQQQYNCETKTE